LKKGALEPGPSEYLREVSPELLIGQLNEVLSKESRTNADAKRFNKENLQEMVSRDISSFEKNKALAEYFDRVAENQLKVLEKEGYTAVDPLPMGFDSWGGTARVIKDHEKTWRSFVSDSSESLDRMEERIARLQNLVPQSAPIIKHDKGSLIMMQEIIPGYRVQDRVRLGQMRPGMINKLAKMYKDLSEKNIFFNGLSRSELFYSSDRKSWILPPNLDWETNQFDAKEKYMQEINEYWTDLSKDIRITKTTSKKFLDFRDSLLKELKN
jgi:hypothetical protein